MAKGPFLPGITRLRHRLMMRDVNARHLFSLLWVVRYMAHHVELRARPFHIRADRAMRSRKRAVSRLGWTLHERRKPKWKPRQWQGTRRQFAGPP